MRSVIIPLGLVLLLSRPAFASAGDKDIPKEQERADKAAAVLQAMVQDKDAAIPEELLKHAHGLAIIPGMLKGAVIVGGRHGKGLAAERRKDGAWSAPLYVEVGGASYGLQLGAQESDLILVFTKPGGLKSLLDDKVKLGADVGVTAGPVGRSAEVGTNLTFDSPVYAYSRSKGLFAGISLDGAVLGVDGSANEAVYGKKLSAEDVLEGNLEVPPVAMGFWKALGAHAPAGE